MAGSLNEVQLIGHLGKDPEIKTFQNGNSIANLRLATSESWKDKESGERQERTEWHTITVGGPLVKVCEKYLAKGSRIFVRGKLTTRKWKDKDGQDRYSVEVSVQGFSAQLIMLNEKGAGGGAQREESSAPKSNGTRASAPPVDDEEMPF